MNADFFFKFTKFKFGSAVNAEDYADRVNYQWTGSFLIISVAIIAMRQYIFSPIQCMVPPEWPRPWEEYTENYCWIQGTYYVEFHPPIETYSHPNLQERKSAELNYYQWVPFVLALESMLVYLPHVVWKILASTSGYNPNSMVKFAAEAATIDQDKKKKLINFLARQIEKAMNSRRQWRRSPSCYSSMRKLCYVVLPFFWFGKRSGTMLFALYIANKMMYMSVGLAHLLLMKAFLGFDSVAFGWECAVSLFEGKEWNQTRTFPRVTFCDVPLKTMPQWNMRTIQCVLPGNLLNEKIYIGLWFLTIMAICLTISSTVTWIFRLLIYRNRQSFVKKYLRILNSTPDTEEEETRKRFVAEFLCHDGVFILRMIAENVGDVVVADIIDEMFRSFSAMQQMPAAMQQQPATGTLTRKPSTTSGIFRRIPPPLEEEDRQLQSAFGKKSIV